MLYYSVVTLSTIFTILVLFTPFSIIIILLYCILAITFVTVVHTETVPYTQPTSLMPGLVYIGLAQIVHKLAYSIAPVRPVPTFLPQTNEP